MSTALEKVVRPSELGDVTPPRRLPDGRKGSTEPVRLRIGRSGRGRVFNGSGNSTTTYYSDAHQNERR